jgi:hypothetical protein
MKRIILAIVTLFASATISMASTNNVKSISDPSQNNRTEQLSRALNLSPSQVEEVSIYNESLQNSLNETLLGETEAQPQMVKSAINNNLRLMKSTLDKEQYRKYVTLVNVTVNNNQRLADLSWQDIYNTMYYAEK